LDPGRRPRVELGELLLGLDLDQILVAFRKEGGIERVELFRDGRPAPRGALPARLFGGRRRRRFVRWQLDRLDAALEGRARPAPGELIGDGRGGGLAFLELDGAD